MLILNSTLYCSACAIAPTLCLQSTLGLESWLQRAAWCAGLARASVNDTAAPLDGNLTGLWTTAVDTAAPLPTGASRVRVLAAPLTTAGGEPYSQVGNPLRARMRGPRRLGVRVVVPRGACAK